MKYCVVTLIMAAVLAVGRGAAAPEKPGIMLGAFLPGNPNFGELTLNFDSVTGKTHTLAVHVAPFNFAYCKWPHLLDQIRDAEKIPVISWSQTNSASPDAAFSNPSFLAGAHDETILKMAQCCKAFGDPVYMRWSSEMNIPASSGWPGHPWNGYSTQGFIDMWRYVRDTFAAAGADNVIWVWSPNYDGIGEGYDTYSNYNNLYPGDDYVDMIGLSGLNYGDHPGSGPGFSVSAQWLYIPVLRDFMAGSYNRANRAGSPGAALRDLARLSGGKPQGLFEFGCVEDDSRSRSGAQTDIPKVDWIRQAYDAIAHEEEFSYVRIVVWYNMVDDRPPVISDFRVVRNPGNNESAIPAHVTRAYRDAIAAPAFIERALSLAEMTPSGYYEASSTVRPRTYPQHELRPSVRSGRTIRKGESLSIAYFMHPPIDPGPGNWRCDAYLAARIPGGGWYTFMPPGKWIPFDPASSAPPATLKGFDVKRESRGMAFTMTMGESLPAGVYTFYSILVGPGDDPRALGPDLKRASFTLSE